MSCQPFSKDSPWMRESWVRFPDKEMRNAIVPILGDCRRYAWMSLIKCLSQDEDFFPIPSIVSHRGFPCLTLLWSCLRCRSVTSLLVHWSVHAASMILLDNARMYARELGSTPRQRVRLIRPFFIEGSMYVTTPTYSHLNNWSTPSASVIVCLRTLMSGTLRIK